MNHGINLFSGSHEPFLDRVKTLTPDFSQVNKEVKKTAKPF
jgi:hypothetical protein